MKKSFLLMSVFATFIAFQSCKKDNESYEKDIEDCGCNVEKFSDEIGEIKKITVDGNTLTLNNYKGINVFEGDIVLTEEQIVRLTAVESDSETSGLKSAGRTTLAARWTNGIVPYVINSSLPNTSRVTAAIAHWESNTNFDFVPRTNQADYIEFVPSTGCASYVGKIGGRQYIWLASGCSTGNTIHEIGHAIGLWHEQTRADRDYSVNINWNNIEAGREHNFELYNLGGFSGFDRGAFDFSSIMLYGSYDFSKNGQPTITRKNGTTYTSQRNSLSATDISGAQHISTAVDLASPTNVLMHHDGDEELTVTWNAVSGANEYWIYTQMSYEVQPKLYRISAGTTYSRELKLNYYSGYKLWVAARRSDGSTSRAVQATRI